MFMYTLFYRKPLLLFWVARRRFYRLKVEADCSLIDSDARRRLLKAQSKLGLGSQTWPFLKSRETPKDVFASARFMHYKCVWILVFSWAKFPLLSSFSYNNNNNSKWNMVFLLYVQRCILLQTKIYQLLCQLSDI